MKIKYFENNSSHDYKEIYDLLESNLKEATVGNVIEILRSTGMKYYTRENLNEIQVFNYQSEYIFSIKK